MASYNKVILIGNLTRDPQMSYLPTNQTAATELGLAVNRRWRGQDGEQHEEVCFVDCRAYGRSAETLNQYLRKGSPVLIDGHLRLDRWEGKDGTKRSKLYVVVDRFQFLGGGRSDGGGEAPPQSRPPAQQAPQQQAPQQQVPQQQSPPPQAPPPEAPQESYPDEFPPAPEGDGGENIPF